MTKNFVSVIALFDDNSNEKIAYIKSALGDMDKKRLPHITLGVYDDLRDLKGLISWCEDFCLSHQSFEINLHAIGVFNDSCLFALPSISRDLYAFYSDFQLKYDDGCRDFFSVNSNDWMPHVGLIYTTKDHAKHLFPKLMDVFEETMLVIKSLRITKKTEKGFVTIKEYDLI